MYFISITVYFIPEKINEDDISIFYLDLCSCDYFYSPQVFLRIVMFLLRTYQMNKNAAILLHSSSLFCGPVIFKYLLIGSLTHSQVATVGYCMDVIPSLHILLCSCEQI